MKHVIRLAAPFALALMLTACGGNNQEAKNEEQDHATMDHSQPEAGATGGSVVIENDQLNAVYQHYVHLTTALINSDVAEAKSAANAIEAGAKDLQAGNAIASSAAKITSASSIEEQRDAYVKLSSEMVEQVKQAGVENGEVFVQFCPMANNDKGATWLSSNKEIRNPYMGEKMLKCGETRETVQ